jgi:hypothetical protein
MKLVSIFLHIVNRYKPTLRDINFVFIDIKIPTCQNIIIIIEHHHVIRFKLSCKTVRNMIIRKKCWNKYRKQTNTQKPAVMCIIHTLHIHIVCLYVCILCIHITSMCLPSFCMSVQPVEVRVHVEMQLSLINGLNNINTCFTIK